MKSEHAAIVERAIKILDELDANIAVLNHSGFIIANNPAWLAFAANNCKAKGVFPQNIAEGANYLDICRNAVGPSSEGAILVYEGIRAVLDGKLKIFKYEYPCHSPDKSRWFSMKVKPLPKTKPREVLIIHEDITKRMMTEIESESRQQELTDALMRLQSLAGDIKNYLNLPRAPLPLSTITNAQENTMYGRELLQTLSMREIEVLTGLIRGERYASIAERLGLSVKSVSTYRSRILKKLKLDSNAELVTFSSKVGFL